MKKKIIFFPFLFALYPVLGLYSRNLTEIQPWEIIRPALAALAGAALMLWLLGRLFRDRERTAFAAALVLLFASSSGLAYRIVEQYLWHGLSESFHRVLILAAAGMIAFLSSRPVWDRYATPTMRRNLVEYLNLVSVFIIIMPLINIGSFWAKSWDDARQPWSSYIAREETPQALSATQRPDIYYIILDAYGRSDVLQALYGFDNSAFLRALSERGFFIADESHTNYLRTSLSVTSSLNMQYINFTSELAGARSTDRIPMFELASNDRARRLLREAGYKFVLVDSGSAFTRFYDADVILTPYKTMPNLFEMWFYGTSSLSALYDPELPISSSLRQILPLAGFQTHRDFIVRGLDHLAAAPSIPGPKFVFAHIIAPHPPFVLDAQGRSLRPPYPYVTGDGATFAADEEAYKKGYTGQLTYINTRILEVVDSLLQNSTQRPVIIIQGDHGPGLLLMHGDTLNSCLWERASILNAYYFPGGKTSGLYPSISPVNSFRVVFNTYFNTSFDLLEDRTYYSLFEVPYDFHEITSQVQKPCASSK